MRSPSTEIDRDGAMLERAVAGRRRAEAALRHKTATMELLEAVAAAANEAVTIQEALQVALDRICAYTGWPVGHACLMAEDSTAELVSSGLWHLDDPQRYQDFRDGTEATRFPAGKGLPGRVLSSGRPAWIFDVGRDPNFPRVRYAIGLKAAFCFPVLVGTDVAAVLEFFSPVAVEPDRQLLDVMEQVGAQLARVAERQRAERVLQDSQRFVQRITEASPNIVYVYDLVEKATVYSNRQLLTLLGYRAEAIQKTDAAFFQTIMHPNDLAALVTHYPQRLAAAHDGEIVEIDGRLKHADGTWRWFHSRNVVFSWTSDGRPKEILGTAEDFTERKLAEARVHQLEELARQRERLADIGAITATLVHDLRNPLGNIALQTYLLLNGPEHTYASPVSVNALQRILTETQRIEHLIDDLMNVSREQRLDCKSIDPQCFLRDVLRPWYWLAEERQISLSLECAEDVPALSADEEKLRRVLDNVIRNALEAIDQGPGAVHVAVARSARNQVRISVRDTGPGIPGNTRVFRMFETTKPNGSGLGLALAKQIMAAHAGNIWYEDLQPHGTAFHLELCADHLPQESEQAIREHH